MKISIITPTLNVSEVLENAVLSVLNQKFTDYEHIILDACSTDGTLDILRKYDHLKWVSEPDSGIYDAMNKGISMARGDWIYFLGADDTLNSEYVLEKISLELIAPAKVVYGEVLSERFDERFGGEFNYQKLFHINICHQAVFFHRDVFAEIGNFDLKYHGQSDWDHNLRWFSNRNIESKHIDMVIADFADGGFSSIAGDDLFQLDKPFKFVKYGYAVIPVSESRKLLFEETKKSIKSKNLNRFLQCSWIALKVFIRWLGEQFPARSKI